MTEPSDITFGLLDMASEANRKKFRELHNKLFKSTNVSDEWINWYLCHLADDVKVYAAFDGDRLVGSWCVESKTLLDDAKMKVPVGRCFSVGVDEEYRRRNIFVNLSKHAIQREKERAKHRYIVGFPQQGRPVVEAHLKSGWYKVQDIDVMSVVPDAASNTSLRKVDVISWNFEDVVQTSYYPSSFMETDRYKDARWGDHPDHKYICLALNDCHVVIKPYSDVCHMLEAQGEGKHFATVLEAAKTLAYRHRWREINCWCATNDYRRDAMFAAGFTIGAQAAASINMLAVDITATHPLTMHACNFQMGCEEMY